MAIETIVGVGTLLSGLFGGRKSSTPAQYDSVTGSTSTNTSTAVQNEAVTSNQATTGSTRDQTQEMTAGVTQNFSSDMVARLESDLAKTLNNSGVTAAQRGVKQQIAAVNAIDPAAQAAAVANAAKRTIMSDVNANINGMESSTGGSTKGNSMLALLSSKLNTDAAAQVAGIRSDALQSAQQSKTEQLAGLAGISSNMVNSMIGSVAGAQQNTAGTNIGSNTQQTQQQQTGTQNTATTANQTTTATELSSTDLLGVGRDGAENSDLLTHVQNQLGVKPRPVAKPPTTPTPTPTPRPPPPEHPSGGK